MKQTSIVPRKNAFKKTLGTSLCLDDLPPVPRVTGAPGREQSKAGASGNGRRKASGPASGSGKGKKVIKQHVKGSRKLVDTSSPHFLRMHKVRSAATRKSYEAEAMAFETWAIGCGHLLSNVNQCDIAMELYLEDLFRCEEPAFRGKCALFGFAQLKGHNSFDYKRSRDALLGWQNLQPTAAKDEMPYDIMCLICEHFAKEGKPRLAAYTALSYDGYYRPSELLTLKREDLIPPMKTPGQVSDGQWAILLAPSESDLRTKMNRADEGNLIGIGDRKYLNKIAKMIYHRTAPKAIVFPFTTNYVAKEFRAASKSLGLTVVNMTPGTMRHGAPSNDMLLKYLNSTEVARRGHWTSLASVRRYERPARLMRVASRLPDSVKNRATSAALNIAKTLENALL